MYASLNHIDFQTVGHSLQEISNSYSVIVSKECTIFLAVSSVITSSQFLIVS